MNDLVSTTNLTHLSDTASNIIHNTPPEIAHHATHAAANSNNLIIGCTIFILTYAIIASEKINKTIAAMLGAFIMLLFKIVDQHTAFAEIDLNVVFLLVGMMIVVHITSKTGVFQWLAIYIAKIAKGKPLNIIVLLCLITAVLSAFLDNVTTVILIAPVSLLICQQLEIDPIPFLVLETLASNIGGTATSIGDPPNILIASASGLSFNDFLIHLAPAVAIVLAVFLYTINIFFKKRLIVSRELRAKVMGLDPSRAITDTKTLKKSLSVMAFIFLLFFVHGQLHLEPATIAMSGATLLILITKTDPEEIFKHVEWDTIFFFIGLFVVIAAVVHIGAISIISGKMNTLFGNQLVFMNMFFLWFSALVSSLIGNIPYTATIIPVIKEFVPQMAANLNIPLEAIYTPLWWALALGACLGGNGTLLGAGANVIIAGIADKNGHKISFLYFLKYGAFFTIQSLILCSAYIYIRYFVLGWL